MASALQKDNFPATVLGAGAGHHDQIWFSAFRGDTQRCCFGDVAVLALDNRLRRQVQLEACRPSVARPCREHPDSRVCITVLHQHVLQRTSHVGRVDGNLACSASTPGT